MYAKSLLVLQLHIFQYANLNMGYEKFFEKLKEYLRTTVFKNAFQEKIIMHSWKVCSLKIKQQNVGYLYPFFPQNL